MCLVVLDTEQGSSPDEITSNRCNAGAAAGADEVKGVIQSSSFIVSHLSILRNT